MASSSPLAEAAAGAIGAVFSNTLVFPLDVDVMRVISYLNRFTLRLYDPSHTPPIASKRDFKSSPKP